jgi:predicted nucleotidyltransferase
MSEHEHTIIEGHYLETNEGLLFAVKGLVHPSDRFVAYLRYAPDPTKGERQKEGRRYRRLYHFEEQEQLLRAEYAQYLAFDPIFQATLQSVPHQFVLHVYDPRTRLQELGQQERDPVEEDALAFASLLQREADIPSTGLGISGSVLISLHTPHSDLDMTVYGTQHCRAVQRALRRLLAAKTNSEVTRLDQQGMEALYAQRVADTRMAFADFVRTEKDKVIQGQFRGRPYFIRFLKGPAEVGESYGDYGYTPLGHAGITASVTDASEAIFTPCRYLLTAVCFIEGSPVKDVTEIVSFRGRFCEQAQAGDAILAFGTLERVQAQNGNCWHRLLIGNQPEDTMLARR